MQDSRRRIWLDAQDHQFHSFEALNVWLGQRCCALWNELAHPHYSGLSVAEVLELVRAELMPMPAPFDGYVERSVRVSSTCLVSIVETGNESYRLQHSSLAAQAKIKSRERKRKGGQEAADDETF